MVEMPEGRCAEGGERYELATVEIYRHVSGRYWVAEIVGRRGFGTGSTPDTALASLFGIWDALDQAG